MNNIYKMARNIAKSLEIAICEYKYSNGTSPAKIFAELDAYYALQSGMIVRYYPEQNITIGGIPLERIDRPGTGIYLSGDPVPIRDLRGCCDIRVVFADGTEEAIP